MRAGQYLGEDKVNGDGIFPYSLAVRIAPSTMQLDHIEFHRTGRRIPSLHLFRPPDRSCIISMSYLHHKIIYQNSRVPPMAESPFSCSQHFQRYGNVKADLSGDKGTRKGEVHNHVLSGAPLKGIFSLPDMTLPLEPFWFPEPF